jgi:phage host-nuclease inhibitor protein Gam
MAVAKSKAAPKFEPPPVDCESMRDADELLQKLGEIDAVEAQVKAECKAVEEEARRKFKDQLFVKVPGGKVSFEDRRRQIRDSIKIWAEANRDEILTGDLKSRKLNFGTIGWCKAPDSIEAIDGAAGNKTVLERITAHLRGAINKFAALCGPVLDCLVIQIKWSRDKLGSAMAEHKIKPVELRAIGFRFVIGEDEFFADPAETRLTSTSEGAD